MTGPVHPCVWAYGGLSLTVIQRTLHYCISVHLVSSFRAWRCASVFVVVQIVARVRNRDQSIFRHGTRHHNTTLFISQSLAAHGECGICGGVQGAEICICDSESATCGIFRCLVVVVVILMVGHAWQTVDLSYVSAPSMNTKSHEERAVALVLTLQSG